MRYAEQLHPQLAPMRLVSRSGRLYTGPCPICADGGEDRFHVWMEASSGRPAERYWCRICDRRGLLKNLGSDNDRWQGEPRPKTAPPSRSRAEPNPQHIPFYRQLHAAVALWAHALLLAPCHPITGGGVLLLRPLLADVLQHEAKEAGRDYLIIDGPLTSHLNGCLPTE